MKDSTSTTPTTTTTTATTTTAPAPTSPTTNKEKTPNNTVFRDTRAELAQLLKKKEEIEVRFDASSSENRIDFLSF